MIREDGDMDLTDFLRARLDATQQALIEYREHRQGGAHINWEGQDPVQYDEYDSCARCIATAKAVPYRDVDFGLTEVAAKRLRIAHYLKVCEMADPTKHPDQAYVLAKGAVEKSLMLDALPYTDHPDYANVWRP